MNYLAKEYNKEAFREYGNAIIEGYQDVVEVLTIVKDAAEKMDGKVLNKRFMTEIENRLAVHPFTKARLSLSDQYNMGYRNINIYLEHRSVCINGSWIYFDKQIYCRNIHNVENAFCEIDSNVNARIVCSKVTAFCDEYIEQCKKYMTKWNDAIENYDKYTEQLKNAIRQFGEAMRGLNDCFCPSEIYKYDWEHTN